MSRGESPPGGGPQRVASIDALRGLDMILIVGGRELVTALAGVTQWPWLLRLETQLHHADWHGCTVWDVVFPLFLFLAGASLAFSLAKRRARGDTPTELRVHVVRRGLLLVALGVLYNAGPGFDFHDPRFASVLGRIGLAYLGAGLIAIGCGLRGQVLWIAGLLLGSWALLAWVPVPGVGAGSYAPGANLNDWLDRALLPGRLHRGVRDPEGILGTFPAIATALFGLLGGRALRDGRPGVGMALALGVVGAACLAIGAGWDRVLPINKSLWTASFVLWTGGWSFALLGLFHLLCDVAGWRRWTVVVAPFGANAILAYLLHRFVDWQGAASRLWTNAVFTALAALAIQWLILAWLARKRVHLRI